MTTIRTGLRLAAPAMSAVLLAGALAACGGAASGGDASAVRKDGSVDLSKVTLRVGDQKSGAQPLLQAAGQLKNVPYKITWSEFTSGPPLLEAVNAGAVDVGQVGNAPPVFSAAARSDIRIIYGFTAGLKGQTIEVPKNSPIHTIAQLRGKRIAVAKGSSAHFHLLSVLTKNGMTMADIKPQFLQPGDALAALTSGSVDAWAIWDPYSAQAEADAGTRVLVDGTGYANGFSFQVSSKPILADKAKVAALRDYLTRYQKSMTWVNAHPKGWAKVWSQVTGMPQNVTLRAAHRRHLAPIPLNAATLANEQRVADAFSDAKQIPGRVVMKDFVDDRFADVARGSGS
ncbi:MAG TPA: ABC transporter substrate-binding protein [Streptosporangiaceae bacterium]|jgi:sulfonate transport system substrate-binding protein